MKKSRLIMAALAPTVAAIAMMVAAGALFAQQGQPVTDGVERIPLHVVTWALTAMATAVVSCAWGCWWLLKQLIAVMERAKESETQLSREAAESRERAAKEVADTVREVMPLTIKLTEFIPSQLATTQALIELTRVLRRDGEGSREARRQ